MGTLYPAALRAHFNVIRRPFLVNRTGWFVKAGMTPEQALRTATANAAELLGKEKEVGAVAPGYFADLVAVEGDPQSDINVAINSVKW